MKSITIDLNWSKGPVYRTRTVAGMQIEAFKRDTFGTYFAPDCKWEYKMFGVNGQEICWGLAHTLREIKKVSAQALLKRI